MGDITLSVIIPAYKEKKRIGKNLTKIKEHLENKGMSYEVLVIVDGSPDDTAEIARSYSDKIDHLRVIDNPENHGKGYVVRQGLLAAEGDFRLQPTSPARDMGIASDVYQTFFDLYGIDIRKDIEGNSRPQGSAWDIGAYEYTDGAGPISGDLSGPGGIPDGRVTILDIQACVKHIIGTGSFANADVNEDGAVNIRDIQAIVRIILGG